MSDKIFFFHNPKAGGSSLKRIIESLFLPETRCPLIENSKLEHEGLRGDYARFRGYHLYAGHYGRDIFAAVDDGHICITNFRHPVSRLLSLYNFFRYSVSLPGEGTSTDRSYAVRVAKSVSFRQFISDNDPRVDVYVRNAHFRQLAHSCWSLETAKGYYDVCRFIDGMPWYYVCEYLDLSVRWMRCVFGWEVDQMPTENVTAFRGSQTTLSILDDETYEIICRKNNLDFAIYNYAVARFLARTRSAVRPSGWRAKIKLRIQNVAQRIIQK
jgi:hypothetical protein